MKFLIVLSVALALVGCSFANTEALFEEREKAEDRAEIVSEERVKDNELLEKSEKESDKFGASSASGEKVSADIEDVYENLFDFKEFEDIAKKNDLAKSDSFVLQLKDESDHQESNVFQSSKGTQLNTAIREKNDLEFDSEVFDQEEVRAESDSEKEKAAARESAAESLFGDRSESLFDSGVRFEFANDNHNDHHEDDGVFGGSSFFGGGSGRFGNSVFDRFRLRTSRFH